MHCEIITVINGKLPWSVRGEQSYFWQKAPVDGTAPIVLMDQQNQNHVLEPLIVQPQKLSSNPGPVGWRCRAPGSGIGEALYRGTPFKYGLG